MNYLVTGGSGYLGTFVRQFFEASDFSRRSSLNILDDVDAQIVENYDVVIHLAGHLDKNPEGAEECFRTNADGTRNIISRMRPGSVFIYATTKDVYGGQANAYEFVPEDCPLEPNPATAFELSKLIGERYVEFYARQRGIRASIFGLWPTGLVRRVKSFSKSRHEGHEGREGHEEKNFLHEPNVLYVLQPNSLTPRFRAS